MDATPAALLQSIEAEKQTWQQSACRKNLLAFLDKHEPRAGWRIDRAVALAIGCLDGDIRQEGQRNKDGREVQQLAVFLDMVEYLQPKGAEKNIALYAQDPIFKFADVAVLGQLNFTIVDPPKAEFLVGEDSFHYVAMLDTDENIIARSPTLFVGRAYEWMEDQAKGRAMGRQLSPSEEGKRVHEAVVKAKNNYERMEICSEDCEHRRALRASGKEGRVPMAKLWLWCKKD